MGGTDMVLLMAAGILILLGILLYQQVYFRKGIQGQLREMSQNLEKILDTDSDEKVLVFTENQALIELASQINRMLESRQKAKADFRRSELASKRMLSNISHDIKTPLTVLLGYLEMMRLHMDGNRTEADKLDREGSDARSQSMKSGAEQKTELEMLQKTEEKAQRVLELINQFFTLAKLESGDMHIEKGKVDICEICRGTVLDFYEILVQKKFQVELSIPEIPVFVWGDKNALVRILSNLISNAIRYGADGMYLGVKIRMEEMEEPSVFVDVQDRGKGIDRAFSQTVFERLFMMEDSHSRQVQGNGLGLTIAKHLALQMEGDLMLESEPFVETTFTVRLKRFL